MSLNFLYNYIPFKIKSNSYHKILIKSKQKHTLSPVFRRTKFTQKTKSWKLYFYFTKNHHRYMILYVEIQPKSQNLHVSASKSLHAHHISQKSNFCHHKMELTIIMPKIRKTNSNILNTLLTKSSPNQLIHESNDLQLSRTDVINNLVSYKITIQSLYNQYIKYKSTSHNWPSFWALGVSKREM